MVLKSSQRPESFNYLTDHEGVSCSDVRDAFDILRTVDAFSNCTYVLAP
jgi:hypothetical protein